MPGTAWPPLSPFVWSAQWWGGGIHGDANMYQIVLTFRYNNTAPRQVIAMDYDLDPNCPWNTLQMRKADGAILEAQIPRASRTGTVSAAQLANVQNVNPNGGTDGLVNMDDFFLGGSITVYTTWVGVPVTLALDASTPTRVAGTSNPATTAAFSPPASSLLIALTSADSSNTFSISGGGLSWGAIGNRNDGSNCALGAFWAWNPNAQSNITVSSTRTGSFTAHQLRLLVVSGAESTFGGATSNAAALTTGITTTRANSWIWAIGGSENGDTAVTAAANCTLNDAYTAFGGVSGGVVKQTNPNLGSGVAFTIGVSGSGIPSILAIEIREALETYNPPTGLPPDVAVSADSEMQLVATKNPPGFAGFGG